MPYIGLHENARKWARHITAIALFFLQEYMDALNQQEIHKKKLVALTQQTTLFQNETTALKTDKDKLQSLYDKQDEILCEFTLYVNYQLGNALFFIRIAYHGTKHFISFHLFISTQSIKTKFNTNSKYVR